MTKNEYLKSLVNSNIPGDKWFPLVKQWEKDNPQTEEVEEVKNTDSTTQDPSVESENNTGSESGSGSSQPQELEVITDKKQALSAKPGQVYSDHGYEYKYEINEKGTGDYYTKKPDDTDWIKTKGVG